MVCSLTQRRARPSVDEGIRSLDEGAAFGRQCGPFSAAASRREDSVPAGLLEAVLDLGRFEIEFLGYGLLVAVLLAEHVSQYGEFFVVYARLLACTPTEAH